MKTLLLYEKDSLIKNPKYQVLKDRAGEYYFRLCARNGEIILASKPYENKKYCFDAINSLKLFLPASRMRIRNTVSMPSTP